MKVLKFLNRSFHFYAINVLMTTWWIFFGIVYHAFTHVHVQIHNYNKTPCVTTSSFHPFNLKSLIDSMITYMCSYLS